MAFSSSLSSLFLLIKAHPFALVLTPFLCFSILLFLLRLLYYTHRNHALATRYRCKAPRSLVPMADPFLGLDFLLKTVRAAQHRGYLALTQQRFREHGPTYVARRALYTTVHTIDPENIKAILATEFQSFSLAPTRVNAMTPLFGGGIFTSTGARWAHSRALLRPTASLPRQHCGDDKVLDMMEKHLRNLLACIPNSSINRTTPTFDLQKLLYSFTMDVGTELLLGKSTNTLFHQAAAVSRRNSSNGNDDEKEKEILDTDASFVRDFTTCCIHAVRQIQLGPFGRFCFMSRATKQARDRAWAYIEGFVDEALRDSGEKNRIKNECSTSLGINGMVPFRLEEGNCHKNAAKLSNINSDNHFWPSEKPIHGDDQDNSDPAKRSFNSNKKYNFLRELAATTTDRAAIRDEILSLLLASRDTTASLVSSLFFELARQPNLYAALRREVLSTVNNSGSNSSVLPTGTQLKSMKLLRWCINESELHGSIRSPILYCFPLSPCFVLFFFVCPSPPLFSEQPKLT